MYILQYFFWHFQFHWLPILSIDLLFNNYYYFKGSAVYIKLDAEKANLLISNSSFNILYGKFKGSSINFDSVVQNF